MLPFGRRCLGVGRFYSTVYGRAAWAQHVPPTAANVDELPAVLLRQQSLPNAWISNFRQAPDRPMLFDTRTGWLTGAELDKKSSQLARRLLQFFKPGDRVVTSNDSSVASVLCHIALFRAGMVVVPANLQYTAREMLYIVDDAAARGAIVDDPARQRWIAQHNANVRLFSPLELLELASDQPASETALPSSDDPALIGYTSGTTGAPKGAILSHGNLLASSEAVKMAWRWTQSDRLVLALPLYHMHGLGVGLHGTLLAGASAVIVPKFDVDVLDAIQEHAATLFFGVPTMYQRLAHSARANELKSLRLCVCGSAPLPADLHRKLEESCSQRVLERYGMTETAMLVSNCYDRRVPGSVGLPLPGVELRLDADTNEVLVRGPNVFKGYLNKPDATAKAFTSDGFFRTGDLASVNEDGFITINGRQSELLICGGFNVYAREVEDEIRRFPGVQDVAVTGTPHEEFGETVTAWLELTPDCDAPQLSSLQAFLHDKLANFKLPRIMHIVDALPRNALGKVTKHRLVVPQSKESVE